MKIEKQAFYQNLHGSCSFQQSLRSELSAALRAAAGQHLAAVRRAHALAETMLLGALTLLRLIRSLHTSSTSLFDGFTDGHRHRSGA